MADERKPRRDTHDPATARGGRPPMKRAGFMQVYRLMQEHLVEAACALLTDLSAEVVEVCDGASLDLGAENVVSMIGYAADTCRGAIVVVSAPSFLRATASAGAGSLAELADMQGELANMLLGRLKLMMLKHGVAFGVTTPTSMVGIDVLLPSPKGGTSTWLRFASARGPMHVRFDVIFEPTFVLPDTLEGAREGDASEGEILVF